MISQADGVPEESPLFTVFTATFNRARVLRRAYRSLRSQSLREFEWVIVDDGSDDETEDLVASWIAEGGLLIRYFKQPHLGKTAALARGVGAARGEFLVTLDSDDACLPHALMALLDHWNSIPDARRGDYIGVTGLCVDPRGRVIGKSFPRDVIDSSPPEMRYRWRMTGDKWGCQRTAVLQHFKWEELAGIGFVPEGVIWASLARRYQTRYVNDALAMCFSDGRGQMSQADPTVFAPGLAYWHCWILNHELDWFSVAPDHFFRSAALYVRFALHSGAGLGRQLAALKGVSPRALWLAAVPVGAALYLVDRGRRRSHCVRRSRIRDVVEGQGRLLK